MRSISLLAVQLLCLGAIAVRERGPLQRGREKDGGCRACNANNAAGLQQQGEPDVPCLAPQNLANCYQPPLQVNCCDPSCPKCLGGVAPRPGADGCLFGCPEGAAQCPGSCPCDACVCCYTSTRWLTETSTCLDATTTTTTSLATSTQRLITSSITTLTSPITFTVEVDFAFTSLSSTTVFASGPTFITSTSSFLQTETSTVFLGTVTQYVGLQIIVDSTTVTVSEQPQTTIFEPTVEVTSSLLTETVTQPTITGFSFEVFSFTQTNTVLGTGTFFLFDAVSDTLTVGAFLSPGILSTTIVYSSIASPEVTLTVTPVTTVLAPSTTIPATFFPTRTTTTTVAPGTPTPTPPVVLKATVPPAKTATVFELPFFQ